MEMTKLVLARALSHRFNLHLLTPTHFVVPKLATTTFDQNDATLELAM